MTGQGLDALPMLRQGSMYYITGFDTFGFCFFCCLVLTRAPDLRHAQRASFFEDIGIRVDEGGKEPGEP